MPDLRVSFPRPCDETWEKMTPAGCDRICGRCDRLIHDLSNYRLDEAEALLRSKPDMCVRARVGADGVVALKPERGNGARRMVIAAAVTAGLLSAGGPAFARDERPRGAIAGKIENYGIGGRIVATDPDGRTYRGKVGGNGRYRIKHLPPGAYTLTYVPDCGNEAPVGTIVVGDGEAIVPEAKYSSTCIVVGLLRIEDGGGRAVDAKAGG
jgi:hypothetical protein